MFFRKNLIPIITIAFFLEVEIMNIKEEIRNSLQPVMLAQYDAIQEGDLCEPPYEGSVAK